jgi:hypothetical protein
MDEQQANDAKALGHEPITTNVRAIRETGLGLAAMVAVAFLITFGLMKYYAAVAGVVPGEQVSVQVPMTAGTPKLNPDQPLELQKLRAEERRILDSYGWTNRAAGIARIPIVEAMKTIAAEGLPQTVQPANSAAKSVGSNQP